MGMLKRRLKQEQEGETTAAIISETADGLQQSSDESSTSESEQDAPVSSKDQRTVSKTKVLMLASRGINARQKHLMMDLGLLLPHAKKESKFDAKRDLFALNELAELNDCNYILYFEARKPQDLYVWMAKSPSGPSVRFHVQNIHTMDELQMPGNCMKNTRAILSFDPVFDDQDTCRLMKDLLSKVFGVPEKHRKTRPYLDHVMHFGWLDGRIWIRNYQIVRDASPISTDVLVMDKMCLQEIGPRLVLHPIRVFEGAFRGQTIWQNKDFVSTQHMRAVARANEAVRHKMRSKAHEISAARKQNVDLPRDELDAVFD